MPQSNGCDEGCDLTIAQLTAAGNRGVQCTYARKCYDGGWWYGAKQNGADGSRVGDTSQLFLGLITVLASQEAGFQTYPPHFGGWGLDKAVKGHLQKFGQPGHEVTDGTTVHTHYGYGDGRFAPGNYYDAGGAMGLLARVITSKLKNANYPSFYGAMPVDHKAVEEFFRKAGDASSNCDIYYLKNATYLAYMRGGDVWTKWNNVLVSMLTETQNPDGSWDFTDCGTSMNYDPSRGGPVFYTSYAILSLGAGYAGLQIFD